MATCGGMLRRIVGSSNTYLGRVARGLATGLDEGILQHADSQQQQFRQASNATAGSGPGSSPGGPARPGSWQQLVKQGVSVNPCKSPLHPAVVAGELELEVAEGEGELSCQEAYNPESTCFGCGPAHPSGLHLRSRRSPSGLSARVTFPATYCAFPGIVNGGIVSTAMDCHGNWQAAVALMDRGCLPRPPLTLTKSMEVVYKHPTPPDTELLLTARVVDIREYGAAGGVGPHRTTVEVELALLEPGGAGPEGGDRLLAVGRGVFKRLGALRSL